jgi:hypothetical protein
MLHTHSRMASAQRRNALHTEHIRAHYPYYLYMNDTTRQYIEHNRNYVMLGHPGMQIRDIIQDLHPWRCQYLYEKHNQPFHENPRKAHRHKEAYIARRRELTEGYTLYPPAIPYTQATVFAEDVFDVPAAVQMRQTPAERELSLLSFMVEFDVVHSQHFTNDHTPQPQVELTTPNGNLSIRKYVMRKTSNPFILFHVQRFSADVSDLTRFPTKKDRRQIIEETASIYPKGGPYKPPHTKEIGDWYVMNYKRRRAKA